MTEHKLPTLPYAYDALEPYIDARTMEVHYSKHHQNYVNNLNTALEKHKEFRDITAENLLRSLGSIPEDIRLAVRNNAGGHANHSMFWQIMKPAGGQTEPDGNLAGSITKVFGNFSGFKETFSKIALGVFGSGWTWLSLTNLGGLEIHSTANQNSPLTEGLDPILCLDLWEHAYYLKYQNRRVEYIENWWNVVNWEKVSESYLMASEHLMLKK